MSIMAAGRDAGGRHEERVYRDCTVTALLAADDLSVVPAGENGAAGADLRVGAVVVGMCIV